MDGAVARLDVLQALRTLTGEVASLDLRSGDDDAATAAANAAQLRDVVVRALALFAELQDLEPAPPEDEPDAWTVSDAAPRIGDVCFAGGLELRRVARELTAAQNLDELVTAAETARRKLRRAVRAVLEVARARHGHDLLSGVTGPHPVADLGAALAVRRLYAEFRRGLRRPTDDSAEAVLVAVRYAGGALAALVASPDYADVRASDRAILRRLRERALRWARGSREVQAGLHLLEDVWTCGDLLRGINLRQELRAHDAAALAALRAPGAAAQLPAWLAHLYALDGLDDGLDALIARTRALAALDAGLPAALVDEILVRLAQVAPR